MKNRKDKTMRAAHIKTNTQGTSNEISFSVLDAAKKAQDESSKDSSRKAIPRIGGISLFTLGRGKRTTVPPSPDVKGEKALSKPSVVSVSSSAAWAAPVDEVARRKAQRLGRRRLMMALCCLIAVAAVSAGVFAVSNSFKAQQSDRGVLIGYIKAAQDADDQKLQDFDDLVSDVVNTPLESLVAGEYQKSTSADSADAGSEEVSSNGETEPVSFAAMRSSALEKSSSAEKELSDAKGGIEQLQSVLVNGADREAANQALTFINARLDMLKSGGDILSAAEVAADAYAAAQDAWNCMLLADSYARDAANLVAKASDDNMNLSTLKSEHAVETLVQARDDLLQAEALYDVDLSRFVEYVNLRIDAQYAAIDSNNAYLNRDAAAMEAANNTYNELDTQAVELIKEIDQTPMAAVEDRYGEQVEPLSASYRSQQAIADEARVFLSDWESSVSL